MGARLDLHVFSGEVLVVASVISVLAVISKVIGCGIPMWREGLLNAIKVGVGMTPRGEVALIVALIGLQMNAISQRAYAIVIFMTAVTTMLPPPLLRILFRDESAQALAETERTPAISDEEQRAEEVLPGDGIG
jgi:Kef-type K+ transport system membrane component KefB